MILKPQDLVIIHGARFSFPIEKGSRTSGGIEIKPLFGSIPKVIEKPENRELYTLLSLFDMIREGRVREKNITSDAVSKLLKSSSTHV